MQPLFIALESANSPKDFGNYESATYWNNNGKPEMWLVRTDINLAKIGSAYPAYDVAYGMIGIVEATKDLDEPFVVLHKAHGYTLDFNEYLIYTPAPAAEVFVYKKLYKL
jgi:hypothetical protein